jgi:hypothetical protein
MERVQERLADEAHEPGEADQVHTAAAQGLRNGTIEVLANGELPVIDDESLDPRRARAIEPRGLRPVRDYDGDTGNETSFDNRIDQCLEVAASTRDENANAASAVHG